MSNYCVYEFVLKKSGVFYIGSTQNLKKRIYRHLRDLSNGTHHCSLLQQAWQSDQNFFLNVYDMPDRETAYNREEKMIREAMASSKNHLLANIGIHSRGGDNLTRNPNRDLIINNITKAALYRNSQLSVEERKTLYGKYGDRNGMFGKKHSLATRQLLSEKMKGHSHNKGCKLSSEHIEKIRIRQKLRLGEKNSFFGRHHSEETKNILREKNLGRLPPNVKNISANGMIFTSCADAARHFKITNGLVTHRLKSKNYPTWFCVDKTGNV